MKRLSLYFLILIISSCRVEESTFTSSFIYNTSTHSIIITPYFQGNIIKDDSVKIEANQIHKILEKNNRGKGSGYSYPLYIAIYDSILITFDDGSEIIHYSFESSKLKTSNKYILFENNRSLYNEANYTRKVKQEDKYSISNEYTFTFTEQDYLDAQK